MSRPQIAPEDCPEPYWHETHYYCPVCTWVADSCGEQHGRAEGPGEMTCTKPVGHDGSHECTLRWGIAARDPQGQRKEV